jgi:hypothetical protein
MGGGMLGSESGEREVMTSLEIQSRNADQLNELNAGYEGWSSPQQNRRKPRWPRSSINERVEAALAAWVAADKALRKVPHGPERTIEHRKLAALTRRAGDDEHAARNKVLALLNPDDHKDD